MRSIFIRISLFATLVAIAGAQDFSPDVVKNAFVESRLPETLGVEFSPKGLLNVIFYNNLSKTTIPLSAGKHILKSDTTQPPSFFANTYTEGHTSQGTDKDSDIGKGPFVIIAVDPDAPTPQNPESSQIRHFLGGNFFAVQENVGLKLVNTTPAISEYRPPNPPATSDPHRYVFLLFDQSTKFNKQTLVTPETTVRNFNVSEFAQSTGLGHPIAGTFMVVAPPPA